MAADRRGRPGPAPFEYRGRAMGTKLHLLITDDADGSVDPQRIVSACRREVDRLERLWSRFLPTSEISALNRSAGPRLVSPETIELIERAIEAWHRTGGRFDPTVLDHLLASGYDRDFADLARSAAPRTRARRTGPSGCGRIVVDRAAGTVELPPDVNVDPGGIGKGLAADRVTALALRLGGLGAMVNLGGDLRCRGRAPSDGGWTVLARSGAGWRSQNLAIADGGVATSTGARRRWTNSDGPAHHLIDPVAGRSRPDAARQVTVVASTAAEAETVATALAATDVGADPTGSGGRTGPCDLEALIGAAGALVVDQRGRQHRLGSIERFLR